MSNEELTYLEELLQNGLDLGFTLKELFRMARNLGLWGLEYVLEGCGEKGERL